uniref:G protein-coupled receptor 155 n=1 Tax=Tetraodon nigroviridis TaxID=99883 RepID=H3DHS7_TETNG
STMSIDKLFPALLQCFGITLCGYVAGRANVITSTQAKGLGNFVSLFALPALLFKNMVLLNFDHVIWSFFWGVLLAKLCVFVIVGALTLLVSCPKSRFHKAGLFSIFATQSNDFALGFPIVEALYKSTNPEYLQYIYLVAPVSLVLLNPIGFALCEIQKWKNEENRRQSKLYILGVIVLQVLKNPLVFMVVIGIVAHFLLRRTIPAVVAQFVDGLANSFGGTALFYLGLSMVGQLGKLTRSTVVTLILLITAKLLLMPLLCKDMVDVLDSNNSTLNDSSLSNYAFLYGVFPTAPSVGIYSLYYNAEIEVVTSGMVICTFLSAPIMYVSAWLVTISWNDPQFVMNSLQTVSVDVSIVSLVGLVWALVVMFLSKKYNRLPHFFTINLFFAQFLTCIGMIVWSFVVMKEDPAGQTVVFLLLWTSQYSTYLWPGLIALSLVLLRRSEHLNVSPAVFFFAGWGVPTIATALLLMLAEKSPDTIDPSLVYGEAQIICTTVVVALSILLGGGSLVCLSRESWARNDQIPNGESTDDIVDDVEEEARAEPEPDQTPSGSLSRAFLDLVPLVASPEACFEASLLPPPGQCGDRCESTDCQLARAEELQQTTDRQGARHLLLCLLLTLALLVNLSSRLWLLLNPVPGRLYMELQFFSATASYGQGLLSFALFGLDKHLIILPCKKRLCSFWNDRKKKERAWADLPEDVRLTCTQFIKYHKDQCHQDIVKKRRCGKTTVADCFLGCDLVDWLQRVGLAQDPGEAVLYGKRLQQGDVLQHIKQEHDFLDSPLYYRFIT